MKNSTACAARYAAVLVAAVAGTGSFPGSARRALGVNIVWIDPADPTGLLHDVNAGTHLNGNYGDGTHWNPGGIPGLTVNLAFNAPGYPAVPYTVTFSADATANAMAVSNPVTLSLNQFHLTVNQATMSATSASLIITNNASLTVANGYLLAQSLDVGTASTVSPLANTFLTVNGTTGNAQVLVHSGSTINVYQTINLINQATFDTGDGSVVNMAPDIASGGYNTGSIVVDNSDFNMGDGATLRGGSVILRNGGAAFAFGSALTFDSLYYNSDLNLSGPAFTMNLQSSLLDPHNGNQVIPTTITGAIDVAIGQLNIINAAVLLTPDSGNSFSDFTVVGNTNVTVTNSELSSRLFNLDGDGAPGTGSTTTITHSALTVHSDMWVGELGNASVNVSNTAINIDGGLIVGDQAESSGTLVLDGLGTVVNTGLDAANSFYGLGHVIVGSFGSGQMTVSGGARVNVSGGWDVNVGLGQVDATSGGAGTLTVTGGGVDASGNGFQSTLDIGTGGGRLFAGVYANTVGVVNITDGGLVFSTDGEIGTSPGAVGVVNLDGGFNNTASNITALSQWLSTGSIYVGDAGTGSLTLSNGALVETGNDFVVGNNTGSTGSVVISAFGAIDVDTNEDGTKALFVGASGTGSLDLFLGGAANARTNAYIGANSTGRGEVTVDGGSVLSVGETLSVGFLGHGTLTISNGGIVASDSAIAGYGPGSSGSVLVDNASWSVNSFFTLAESGSATMSVQNLAGVTTGDVNVAIDALSKGTLTIDNATWASSGFLTVGVGGPGVLAIRNGGNLSNTDGGLGFAAGSSGNATVSGAGSLWKSTNTFTVGNSGNGTLTISSLGGVINGNTAYMGNATGSFGEVVVTGAGATWAEGGDMNIGVNGGGLLMINQGGSVNSNDTTYVAFGSQSTGSLIVQDPGSNWTNNGNVFIGEGGSGTLVIQSAASATTLGALFVGQNAGATGQVTISGTGSALTSNSQIAIGVQGSGTMTLLGGAHLSATAPSSSVSHTALAIGEETTGIGVLSVSGAGTQVVLTGHMAVGFGANGSNTSSGGFGSVSILNGAVVSDTNGYIGRYAGASGIVTVSGSGARWSNSGALFIAANDTGNNLGSQVLAAGVGTLSIGSGGSVSALATSVIGVSGLLSLQGGSYAAPSTNLSGLISGNGAIFGSVAGSGTVTATGASPLVSDGITASRLIVNNSDQIRSNGSASGASKVSSLTLAGTTNAWTGKLDITNNLLVVEATPANKAAQLAQIFNQVANGVPGAVGIVSTTLTTSTAIAVVDNGTLGTFQKLTTFRSQPVDANSIFVVQALKGDTNLDGSVNATDLLNLLKHYNTADTAWNDGNSTYNASVGSADLLNLLKNYNTSTGGFSLAAGGSGAGLAPAGNGGGGNSSPVPEPASLAVLALGGGALLARRRRR